ncbi:MAG: copper chaperone PCu(A)C [Candidatus Nanopelagicales bacterium]
MRVASKQLTMAVMAATAVVALVGCGSSQSTPTSTSPTPSITPKPGGLTSLDLVMNRPVGDKLVSVVSGVITNYGVTGSIVSGQAPVAEGVSFWDGTKKVNSIQVPTGEDVKLTPKGKHIVLSDVDLNIDNDGTISLTLETNKDQSSLMQVSVQSNLDANAKAATAK